MCFTDKGDFFSDGEYAKKEEEKWREEQVALRKRGEERKGEEREKEMTNCKLDA